MIFQLHKTGTFRGKNGLASKLDRNLRGIAIQRGHETNLDAFEKLGLIVGEVFQHIGWKGL